MAVSERTGAYGIYWGNDYNSSTSLSLEQMKINATYIYKSLTASGWTLNAIAGTLGNMQAESSINPGRWQSDDVGNLDDGYGLVQWTPASKYINWITVAKDPSTMDNNLSRIAYEIANNLQWIETLQYQISFKEYTQATLTPEDCASVWLKNYERAGVEVELIRRTNAKFWYDYLGGEPITTSKKKRYPFVLYANKIRNHKK